MSLRRITAETRRLLRGRAGFICISAGAVGFFMECFDRLQFAGLALLCLKNETKADGEHDLRDLISLAGTEVTEKARRERLLLQTKRIRWNWQSTALSELERLLKRRTSNNDFADCLTGTPLQHKSSVRIS